MSCKRGVTHIAKRADLVAHEVGQVGTRRDGGADALAVDLEHHDGFRRAGRHAHLDARSDAAPGDGARRRTDDARLQTLVTAGQAVSGAFDPSGASDAEEFIAAHVREPITLSDVLVDCGCSQSALYYAFKTNRGYTPMQFLVARRLELARERLLNDPAGTATAVALECGFTHYGRFVKAYRDRFGETPSATRAKLRETAES